MRTHWAGPPGSSARDLAIPVGRGNPPPEVQFRQMAQPGWVPEPDVFEMPDADKLHAVICDHITRKNIRAPGFDLISAPFTKHAVKVVRVEGSRKPQHVNVLAPYLARLFALMMSRLVYLLIGRRLGLVLCTRKVRSWIQGTIAC